VVKISVVFRLVTPCSHVDCYQCLVVTSYKTQKITIEYFLTSLYSPSVSQEIPSLLLNSKVHYHIHWSLQVDNILNQINPVHTFTSYLFKIRFNIVLPMTPASPKWSLYFRISDYNFVCISNPGLICLTTTPMARWKTFIDASVVAELIDTVPVVSSWSVRSSTGVLECENLKRFGMQH
jgi:hypothetical protein